MTTPEETGSWRLAQNGWTDGDCVFAPDDVLYDLAAPDDQRDLVARLNVLQSEVETLRSQHEDRTRHLQEGAKLLLALQEERDRYREALEEIAAEQESCPAAAICVRIAREALGRRFDDGNPKSAPDARDDTAMIPPEEG